MSKARLSTQLLRSLYRSVAFNGVVDLLACTSLRSGRSAFSSSLIFSLRRRGVAHQVVLEDGEDPLDVSFSWTWSVVGSPLQSFVQGSHTDQDFLVILPGGLQAATWFTVNVTMSRLSNPDLQVTLHTEIYVHAGLIALPGGIQVRPNYSISAGFDCGASKA
jgi:hypothetical protein